VGESTTSNVTLKNLAGIQQSWAVASPASIGGGAWTQFSAVAWFFGRDISNALGGTVPIGLISNNWAATPIQNWMSPAALAKCSPWPDSCMYNSMIAPFQVGPMALTGVIWYQGESNSNNTSPEFYSCCQVGLVEDWRAGFQSPSLWFGVVQLAPFFGGLVEVASTRLAQQSVLTLPNTALASAIDLGDNIGDPFTTMHPRYKQAVSARLAANALVQIYGMNLPRLSPMFLNATGRVSGRNVSVTVTFVPETVVDGLVINRTASDAVCTPGVPAWVCAGFQIQLDSEKGPQLNATPSLSGTVLTLTAEAPAEGSFPFLVLSGATCWPVVTLYSKAGFPALPFNATVYPE